MIRDFAAGDEAAVAALERECFSEPWSENAIIESLNSGTLFFLFEEAEEILGYAGLQVVLDEGYVTNIAVTDVGVDSAGFSSGPSVGSGVGVASFTGWVG